MSHLGNGFVPLDFERLSPQESLCRSIDFRNHMRTRRTVRSFSPEPVPFDIIENAIATAGSAPSGANQQPWRFVVVQDIDVRCRIRQAVEAEERENYTGRMSPEWLEAIAPLGTDWQKPQLTEAPYVIAVFALDFGIKQLPSGAQQRVDHFYPDESVGIAVGILVTALHMAGLATLIHRPAEMRFLNEILNRPRNERPFVLIPVGYPASNSAVPILSRKPLDEIMTII